MTPEDILTIAAAKWPQYRCDLEPGWFLRVYYVTSGSGALVETIAAPTLEELAEQIRAIV